MASMVLVSLIAVTNLVGLVAGQNQYFYSVRDFIIWLGIRVLFQLTLSSRIQPCHHLQWWWKPTMPP